MITPQRVRDRVGDQTLTDTEIQTIIDEVNEYLIGYTKNNYLNDVLAVDPIRLDLVAKEFNKTLKGMEGIESRNIGGMSINRANDLTNNHKTVLKNYSYLGLF